MFNFLLSMSTTRVHLLSANWNIRCQILFTDMDGPVQLDLPEQWLQGIIDEFTYKLQSFSVERSEFQSKSKELLLLIEGGQVCCGRIHVGAGSNEWCILGVKLLQYAERAVLLDPKVQDQ